LVGGVGVGGGWLVGGGSRETVNFPAFRKKKEGAENSFSALLIFLLKTGGKPLYQMERTTSEQEKNRGHVEQLKRPKGESKKGHQALYRRFPPSSCSGHRGKQRFCKQGGLREERERKEL